MSDHILFSLEIPLLEPDLHPLRPHSRQASQRLTPLRRLLSLKLRFLPTRLHLLEPLQQFDSRILRHIFSPRSRSLQCVEPCAEIYGLDVPAQLFDDCGDESFPGAVFGVDDIVITRPCGR